MIQFLVLSLCFFLFFGDLPFGTFLYVIDQKTDNYAVLEPLDPNYPVLTLPAFYLRGYKEQAVVTLTLMGNSIIAISKAKKEQRAREERVLNLLEQILPSSNAP